MPLAIPKRIQDQEVMARARQVVDRYPTHLREDLGALLIRYLLDELSADEAIAELDVDYPNPEPIRPEDSWPK